MLLFEQTLEKRKVKLGPQHRETLRTMAYLGDCLVRQGKGAEAEPLLRACLATQQQKQPDDWLTFNTQSILGGALLTQKKYAEAEPLLVQGFEGMKQREKKIPLRNKMRLTGALERLVQLYDAWGKKGTADEWRKRLVEQKASAKK